MARKDVGGGMYICRDCKQIFTEPYVEYDDPSPSGVGLPSGAYAYTYCPYCGSDRIRETYADDFEEGEEEW